MWASGAMEAKPLCIWCWIATMSGCTGIDDLGMRPGQSSGNYNKHLKLVLGLNDDNEEIQHIELPLFSKYSQKRELVNVAVIPPHEAMRKDWEVPEPLLKANFKPEDWADNFFDHPVTRKAGVDNQHLVAPYALYTDSTPFTKPDNFYGVFIVDLRHNAHHLVAILIKAELCQCGCHGWCTIDRLHRWLVRVWGGTHGESDTHTGIAGCRHHSRHEICEQVQFKSRCQLICTRYKLKVYASLYLTPSPKVISGYILAQVGVIVHTQLTASTRSRGRQELMIGAKNKLAILCLVGELF